jgi:centrosomal CEP192-like protein/ASPM-SPD-2-Hydin domain-containing protein
LVFVLRSTQRFVVKLSFVASLLLVATFAIGCAGYTQKAVPGLSLSASSLNFQTVAVGQKVTKTFSISNSGTVPLRISALSVSSKVFSVAGPSLPQTILPANSLAYTLTFAPTSTGAATANVQVSLESVAKAGLISLVGTGEAAFANLLVSPNTVSFGDRALKSTSTQNVTLQNIGDINVALQGVTVSGAGFGYSDLAPGFSLAPNQKVTFQVWFSPKLAGPASATLSLLSPNLSSPETLSMSGQGVSSATSSPTPPSTAQHTVDLNWNASPGQVIGYRVYRSETSGSSYSSLTGTAVNELSYSDSTVSSGSTYYYVVTSVDAAGTESGYSNQAKAVIP